MPRGEGGVMLEDACDRLFKAQARAEAAEARIKELEIENARLRVSKKAAEEYIQLTSTLLAERGAGKSEEELEAILSRMDVLWWQMTDEEQVVLSEKETTDD